MLNVVVYLKKNIRKKKVRLEDEFLKPQTKRLIQFTIENNNHTAFKKEKQQQVTFFQKNFDSN